MSEVKEVGAKKQSCGDMHHIEKCLRDVLGGMVNLQITGTDPDVGVVNATLNLLADYAPDTENMNPDGTFMITIETDNATYFVSLADGSDFIITPTQSHAYLGQWYPAKLHSVNIGTTGAFSVGY